MKKTRTNKNHYNNKKIKIAVITTLTVLTLGFIALTTAIYLQPAHYKGDTFTNAKTSVSSTISSTSSSSSNTTESTNNNITDTNSVYTESTTYEQLEQRGGTCLGQTPPNQVTNNNTLTEDIVYGYVGWDYQEAIIKLKNNYGITGAVTETVETCDFKDNEIISASYENNTVYFKIAKHVDTNPYLPVDQEPSEEIKSETGEE